MRTPFTAALAVALLCACGGGSSPPPRPPGDRNMQISWTPNHARTVNSAGGGYRVTIAGRPEVNLPYAGGAFAPTSITTTLHTGTYTVTVVAYGALDAAGGQTGSQSAPGTFTLSVP